MPTKLTAILGAFLLAPPIVGCTPTFSVFDSEKPTKEQTAWQGPTVKILVNHLTCELVNEYETGISNTTDPDEAALWKNLADDHFVAAIDLNLVLTQIEGLNPGYSGITPLNALGQGIPIQTQSGNPPITTFASGANNLTLAIGAQLSGTQDNTIDLTYVVDMSRIDEEVAAEHPTDPARKQTTPLPGMPDCSGQGNDNFHHGLRGSLDLGTNIDEVLTGIDASGGVNVYGSTGPFAPVEISPSTHAPSALMANQKLALALAAAPSKAASSGGGGAPTGASSTTGFSFKIDFTVLAGLSGGPSWTLLQAKYPVAPGSSSGQLANYSHQTVDTLTMTFAPTCTSPTALVDAKGFKPIEKQQLDVSLPSGNPAGLLVLSGIDPNSLASINASGVLGATALGSGGLIVVNDPNNTRPIGTISWSGYATIRNASDSNPKTVYATLSGTITKNSTQRPIGRIVLQAIITGKNSSSGVWTSNGVTITSVQVNSGEIDTLLDNKRLASFWETIPPCDTLTGPAIQNIWDNAAAQAQLFKLTSGLTGR